MKGMGRMILGVGIVTLFVGLYVHEQVELFRISYALNQKSDILAKRSEEYRHLKYDVQRLKAPRLLESKMKNMDLDLNLPQEVRVLRVPIRTQLPDLAAKQLSEPFTSKIIQFFGQFGKVAQANTLSGDS